MITFSVFLLLFFVIILFLPSVSMASAYFDDCITMNKVSNDKLICVFHDTLQKLIDRDYAYVEHDWQLICDNNINSPHSCHMIRYDDKLCIFIVSESERCIEEYDKPQDYDECFNEYKLQVRYLVQAFSPHSNDFGIIDEYFYFSHDFCDLDYVLKYETQERDGVIYQITHHRVFVENYGVPDSLFYRISAIDESSPVYEYGTGYFLSPNGEKHNFTYTSHGYYLKMKLID